MGRLSRKRRIKAIDPFSKNYGRHPSLAAAAADKDMAPAAHELQAHTDTVSKRQRLRMGMSQRAQNKAKAAAAASAGAGGGHQTAKQAKYAAVAGNVYWLVTSLCRSLCVCALTLLPTPPSAAKAASAKKVVKDQIQKQVTPHESRSHSSRCSTGGKPCPCALCACVCTTAQRAPSHEDDEGRVTEGLQPPPSPHD